jgi:hypothetical protein
MRLVTVIGVTLALSVGGAVGACAKAPDAGDSVQDDMSGDASATTDKGHGDSTKDAGADAKPACIPTDAGCTTSSPGACGAGTMDCDDAGAPICKPIVTSQACYSGPPATRGKGACTDGAQACVGTLGACTGEVLPAARENCFNTIDDDCDGVVNNGCPDHLVLGAPTPLGVRGGTGGLPRTALCPANAFVTRTTFYFDHQQAHASGVAIYCAAPTLVQGASSYSVSLTQVAPAPYVVVTGNNPPTPDANYDCGITGLVAGSWIVGQSDSSVEGLGMHCSSGAATFAADNTLTFDFTESGAANDYFTYQSGAFFRDDCPPHQVLIGYNLRVGDWMDQIQAVCAPLTTVYK